MGCLWQQLILAKSHSVFRLVCIEELLGKYQKEYYEALHKSDLAGSSESFIEFMSEVILEVVKQTNSQIGTGVGNNFMDRLFYAKNFIDKFKRAKYQKLLPGISFATSSRDLEKGVKNGILQKINSKKQTVYVFV